jgi:hypothetical protein
MRATQTGLPEQEYSNLEVLGVFSCGEAPLFICIHHDNKLASSVTSHANACGNA